MTNTQPRDHIPTLPSWFKFLIIGKIVVAVAVLGLAAYAATFNDFFGGNGYAIFCAIAIFITEAYFLTTTIFVPSLFNALAYFILSIFQAVWWLACWADLASWAAAYKLFYAGLDYSDLQDCATSAQEGQQDMFSDSAGYNERYMDCIKDRRKKHRDTVAAAAGIGALEWILVVVSLVFFALALWKHKNSGAPYTAGGGWRTTPENPQGIAGGAAGHTESHQMNTKSAASV